MIFKLVPMDLQSDHWRASIYCGKVIVRAESEERARHLAQSEFGIFPQLDYSKSTPLYPWHEQDLIQCLVIEDPSYPESVVSGILYPRNHIHK